MASMFAGAAWAQSAARGLLLGGAYRGAQFGHIRKKFTLPIGLPIEMDAGAGTIKLLSAAAL